MGCHMSRTISNKIILNNNNNNKTNHKNQQQNFLIRTIMGNNKSTNSSQQQQNNHNKKSPSLKSRITAGNNKNLPSPKVAKIEQAQQNNSINEPSGSIATNPVTNLYASEYDKYSPTNEVSPNISNKSITTTNNSHCSKLNYHPPNINNAETQINFGCTKPIGQVESSSQADFFKMLDEKIAMCWSKTCAIEKKKLEKEKRTLKKKRGKGDFFNCADTLIVFVVRHLKSTFLEKIMFDFNYEENDDEKKSNEWLKIKPPAVLQDDVMKTVIEKIIFSPDNEYRLDLREFDALKLMFVNRASRNGFWFQFRRFKKVYFTYGGLELRSPIPIEGRNTSSLLNTGQPRSFQGPVNLNDSLFFLLLREGVLRLKMVEAFYAFGDHKPQQPANGMNGERRSVAVESTVESLIKLFLYRDTPEWIDDQLKNDFYPYKMELELVKVTDNAFVFAHLDRIFNLNAIELHLELVTDFSECLSITLPRVFADRTRQVTLIYTIDISNPLEDTKSFPFEQLGCILKFVTSSCPNLQRFHVRFSLGGEFSEEDFTILSKWLCDTVKKLSNETLNNLMCACELTISFHAFFPESTLLKANTDNHEISSMGEKKTSIDEEEIYIDEDGISSIGSTENGANSAFTISRQLAVRSSRLKTICYSLVGIQEDNTQEDWNGFLGNAPVLLNALEWNGFDENLGDEDVESDNDEYLEANSEEPTGAILNEY